MFHFTFGNIEGASYDSNLLSYVLLKGNVRVVEATLFYSAPYLQMLELGIV
jgi:hypothetical protein